MPLPTLPTELLLEIVFLLPSVAAALPLLSINRRLRTIWLENARSIYLKLDSDPCARHATMLLQDQRSEMTDNITLSSADVLFLSNCFHNVQNAMSQFNEHVMSKIKRCQVPPFRLARRPRYLTPCERNRFSRTYYQLWGLMQLSQASRSERLSKTTLRQLYNLYDIASIKVPIGDEVCERAKSWSSHFDASAQRERVRAEIWTMLENKCQHFHRCKPEDVWDYGVLDHGFDNHVVILDCYQDELKRTCYGFAIQDTKFTPEFVLKYLWDDE